MDGRRKEKGATGQTAMVSTSESQDENPSRQRRTAEATEDSVPPPVLATPQEALSAEGIAGFPLHSGRAVWSPRRRLTAQWNDQNRTKSNEWPR